MKQTLIVFLSFLALGFIHAQEKAFPEFTMEKAAVESHMLFLASDELQGRRTGEIGNQIAARYIAAHLKAYGVKTVEGAPDYMQPLGLRKVNPIENASLTWKNNQYTQQEDLKIFAGNANDLEAKTVFAGHGWIDEENGINDYKGLDVKDKIVITIIGTVDSKSPQVIFQSMNQKKKWAQEQGAIGMIELFQASDNFWKMAGNYFSKPKIELFDPKEKDDNFIYGWIKESGNDFASAMKDKKQKITINSQSTVYEVIESSNVIGVIEGSDPVLKNEYVMLSAHYDHVGTGKSGGGAFTAKDSIFNGARDNAFGTVALLSAAKALAMNPPKRSIIILAVTAEEMGLLGSRYYADHPLIPLNQTIFNLNSDGAGYNIKDRITIIGLKRSGIATELEKGAGAFGLQAGDDPAPQQGLFDRSDNASFASKGIPASNVAPGMTSFDAEIMKYYHQVTDNPETVDFDYLLKFCQAYTHTARLIADRADRPFWEKGDKYEKVGKELYEIKD